MGLRPNGGPEAADLLSPEGPLQKSGFTGGPSPFVLHLQSVSFFEKDGMRPVSNAKRSLLCLLAVTGLGWGAHAQAATGLTWRNGSDLLAVGLPALAAGSAWGQNDTEGFKQLTLSMVTTVGTAELLKRTVHEMRPDGSDNKSFPSGHTAVAFAAVRFMDTRYGEQMTPYTPWLYVAAGMTGVARVEANKHHWRDVLAGGALGWGASQLWTQPVQGGQLSVVPANKGMALAWQRTW
jgi:membrane-associated phospholipid phosphatase